MKTFETNFQGQDGIDFYVQGWEPDDGMPKALIALVHGLGEHTGRYGHVGQAMTEAGYALAGFDLRGHGRSGGARGHASSLDAYMQDIHQFLGLLEPRYADIPHFLYGHSLGGLLTLTYAIQYGAGLQGVVVASPGLRSALEQQKAKVAMVRLLGSFLPTFTARNGLDPLKISRDPEVVQAYRQDPLVHDSASLAFGKAGLEAVELCFARAREFPVPLLMLHGTGDEIAFPGGSEEFAKRVGEAGGEVTLKTWDGWYHELHNEPEKAEVFKFMIDWLNQHL